MWYDQGARVCTRLYVLQLCYGVALSIVPALPTKQLCRNNLQCSTSSIIIVDILHEVVMVEKEGKKPDF